MAAWLIDSDWLQWTSQCVTTISGGMGYMLNKCYDNLN